MFAAGKTKGASAAVAATYIEDVFSTWLYTGTGAAQTITNGIDLSTKGGLVWQKARSGGPFSGVGDHVLTDTARGNTKTIYSDTTGAQNTVTDNITAFNTTGFSLGTGATLSTNDSGTNYASWTFRKQPKFFDVVTYTGNGSSSQAVPHNLGSVPGCVIVKQLNNLTSWFVWHRGTSATPNQDFLIFNTTAAATTGIPNAWSSNAFTATNFYVSSTLSNVNTAGQPYVAYVFAHNAGGFGLTGTDNVISCGSFTTDGSGNMSAPVNLGYEPQWLLLKTSSVADNWMIVDTMRGWSVTGNSNVQELYPNLSNAEGTNSNIIPTATGFTTVTAALAASQTYIYIAIRRGPMKTPTSGTSVFVPTAYTGNGGSTTITAGFPVDLSMFRIRTAATGQTLVNDRLRGVQQRLFTDATSAESQSVSAVTNLASNTAVTVGANGDTNSSGLTYVSWMFRRAPGFFDEVCYTGTGSATTQAHNLGVAPELMIVKRRDSIGQWLTYSKSLNGGTNPELYSLVLQTTGAQLGPNSVYWNSTAPTSTVFSIGTSTNVNASGGTYVAYLFASCPGVSKVFSFTGNGTTQTINCGFTGGARFVLLKASSSTGGWYVYDTARGMTTLTDPYLFLNSTAAETATLGSVTTVTGGFAVNEAITTGVNTNGVTYIGLAIA